MDFGLHFARRRVHAGQGTSNACTLFDNAYLELLYRHQDDELRSEVVRGLGLWERLRWRETGACPFGVALREAAAHGSPDDSMVNHVVSGAWMYRPAYLPPGVGMPIVTPPGSVREPMVFVMPRELRPPSGGSGQAGRDAGLPPVAKRLGGVVIEVPSEVALSTGVRALCEIGLITVQPAREYGMKLTLKDVDPARGGATAGEFTRDFRPVLPLVLMD